MNKNNNKQGKNSLIPDAKHYYCKILYIYYIYILILTYINILPHVQIEKKDYVKAYIKLPQSLLKLSC